MVKINLKGPIVSNSSKSVYDWLGWEACCPKDVTDHLPDTGEDVELIVNSPGGIVDCGSEMYTALMEYEGNVTAKIVGMAASAMSVAVMGATKRVISPTGRMMVHNASRRAEGDHRAMASAGNSLSSADIGIRNAYKSRTGLSDEELTDLMNKETYLDAESAVSLGFADEVMFKNENEVVEAIASIEPGMLPDETINKIITIIAKEKPDDNQTPTDNSLAIKQMKNELLREEILNSL
ncbi:Clp protease ClpP [Enterococcus rotai]|uniref:Clp protease ClpP n=1 Tax=Enterococcus rotai TaxID=118060 RepID=UPI0035C6F639